MTVEGIVLAAGLSSRAGVFKMTLDVSGKPMVERSVEGMTGVCGRVIVVGGYRIERIREALAHLPDVDVVLNPAYREGMYSSVKAGVRHIRAERFFVIPGDCPFVRRDVYQTLLRYDDDVVIPTFRGRKGHPVLLRRSLASAILGDGVHESLRDFLAGQSCTLVDVGDGDVLRDVDTPGDLDQQRTI